MITDWNSPQGDFDPTEKQGELLMLLSGQHVTVHTNEEADFDYMENEDVAFVVKNPHNEPEESDYEHMKRDIAAILAGNAGVLSLYAEDRWLGSTLCPEKVAADADVGALLERCWEKQEPKDKLLAQGGRVELLYWDPAQNRSFVIPAKG